MADQTPLGDHLSRRSLATESPLLDPEAIARTEFSHSMRGYDTHEVRAFLHVISDDIAELQIQVAEMRASAAGHVDAQFAARSLGEADELKRHAEAAAQVALGRAKQQGVEIVQAAEAQSNRMRLDAVRELETSRERARAMGEETRIHRENALRTLSEKRQQARIELAQLRAAIDELRRAHTEMARLVAEAGQVLESAVPSARAAAESVGEGVSHAADTAEAVRSGSGEGAPVISLQARRSQVEAAQARVTEESVAADQDDEHLDDEHLDEGPDDGDEELVADEIEERRLAERRQTFERDEGDGPGPDRDDVSLGETVPMVSRRERGDIDQLHARIRDSRAEVAAHARGAMAQTEGTVGVAAVEQPQDEVVALRSARDAVAARVGAEAALSLKRVLADQLNEVLDVLRRRGKKKASIDDLVPQSGDAVYGDSLAALLDEAARQGSGGQSVDVGPIALAVGAELGTAVRSRVAVFLKDPDRLEQRIRSLYRELRRERVEALGHDAAAAAFGLGVLDVLPAGANAVWVMSEPPCEYAECHANAAAGPVPVGTAFATGDVVAPSRTGCGCIVAPAGQ